MLHDAQIRSLRSLSAAQRLRLGLDLTDVAWRFLASLPPAEAQRRLELGREPWDPPRVPETARR